MEYAGDGHDHWHLQRFITLQLYKPTEPGTVLGLRKLGFCLIDEEFRRPDLPNAMRRSCHVKLLPSRVSANSSSASTIPHTR